MLINKRTKKDEFVIKKTCFNTEISAVTPKVKTDIDNSNIDAKKNCSTDRGFYGDQPIKFCQINKSKDETSNINRVSKQHMTMHQHSTCISSKNTNQKQNQLNNGLQFATSSSIHFPGKRKSQKVIKTEMNSVQYSNDLNVNKNKKYMCDAARIFEKIRKPITINHQKLTSAQQQVISPLSIAQSSLNKQVQKVKSISKLHVTSHSASTSPIVYNQKQHFQKNKYMQQKNGNRNNNSSLRYPTGSNNNYHSVLGHIDISNNEQKAQFIPNSHNLYKLGSERVYANYRPFCANHRTQAATHYTVNQLRCQNVYPQSQPSVNLYFCGLCALMVATKGFKIYQIPVNIVQCQNQNRKVHNGHVNSKIQKNHKLSENYSNRDRSSANRSIREASSQKKIGKAIKLLENAIQVINEKQKYSISTFENAETELQRQISQINLFFMEIQKFLQNKKQLLLQRLQNQKSQIVQLKNDISQVFSTLRQKAGQFQKQLPYTLQHSGFDFSEQNWRDQLQNIERSANQITLDKLNVSKIQLNNPKQICKILDAILVLKQENDKIYTKYEDSQQQPNSTVRSNKTFEEQGISQVKSDKQFPMVCSLKVCSEYQVRQQNESIFRDQQENKVHVKQRQQIDEEYGVLMSIGKYDIRQGSSIEGLDSKSSSMNISGFLFERGNESSCLLEFK